MSEYAIEILEQQPLVHDTAYIDASTDTSDDPATGAVVVIDTQDGEPNDEEVVTFVAGSPNTFKTRPASGGFVPTFIASGQTFTVPDNKQALYAVPIDNEGTIDIGSNAYLVFVD